MGVWLSLVTPNILPWTTNMVLHWSSSGSNMSFWYDNGTAATDATIYNPDGSTVDIGHSTSGSPSATLTSVGSGSPIFALLWYKLNSGMYASITLTAPSQTQVNNAYADGGYVAINATTSAATNIVGGGSGSKQGGGGGAGGKPFL
jgi:hypothetical protein